MGGSIVLWGTSRALESLFWSVSIDFVFFYHQTENKVKLVVFLYRCVRNDVVHSPKDVQIKFI